MYFTMLGNHANPTTPTISGSNDSYHNATSPAYFHATRHVYTMLLCKPWQSTLDMHLSSYDSTSREGGVASRGDKGGGDASLLSRQPHDATVEKGAAIHTACDNSSSTLR